MSPADEEAFGVMAFRLKAVEEGLVHIRDSLDGRFDRLSTQVASLGFVSRETFDEARRSDRLYAEETRNIAQGARTVSVSILMSFAAVVIAAAIGIFLAAAR